MEFDIFDYYREDTDAGWLFRKSKSQKSRLRKHSIWKNPESGEFCIIVCFFAETREMQNGVDALIKLCNKMLPRYIRNLSEHRPVIFIENIVKEWRKEQQEKRIYINGDKRFSCYVPSFIAVAGNDSRIVCICNNEEWSLYLMENNIYARVSWNKSSYVVDGLCKNSKIFCYDSENTFRSLLVANPEEKNYWRFADVMKSLAKVLMERERNNNEKNLQKAVQEWVEYYERQWGNKIDVSGFWKYGTNKRVRSLETEKIHGRSGKEDDYLYDQLFISKQKNKNETLYEKIDKKNKSTVNIFSSRNQQKLTQTREELNKLQKELDELNERKKQIENQRRLLDENYQKSSLQLEKHKEYIDKKQLLCQTEDSK